MGFAALPYCSSQKTRVVPGLSQSHVLAFSLFESASMQLLFIQCLAHVCLVAPKLNHLSFPHPSVAKVFGEQHARPPAGLLQDRHEKCYVRWIAAKSLNECDAGQLRKYWELDVSDVFHLDKIAPKGSTYHSLTLGS